jgi:hypothetical protein
MAPESEEKPEKHSGNSPEYIPDENVYAYNLDDGTTPGGIKVRFKIRIETGQKARHWDAVQNQAIKELLEWARHRQGQQRRS